MTYKIIVEETLARTITVEAENEEEAFDKVEQAYRDCEIVLDAEDYVDTDFYLAEELNASL